MDTFQMYEDIKARTNGEIYIGVVGPVRTGKSTFIKRFMDVLVLPYMEDEHEKARTRDELPQSGSGKTIMTTEIRSKGSGSHSFAGRPEPETPADRLCRLYGERGNGASGRKCTTDGEDSLV